LGLRRWCAKTKAEEDRWEKYDEDSMDSSGAVQIARNSGGTMRTAKAEPILEGRGWTVQRRQ
jgi:hypothetical protein